MRFGVLGPLAVWTSAGEQLTVPGLKVRALLADLLVHAGEPVSADRLVDDLWGERAPADPAGALQAKVSQLRRVLAAAGPDGRALVEYRPPRRSACGGATRSPTSATSSSPRPRPPAWRRNGSSRWRSRGDADASAALEAYRGLDDQDGRAEAEWFLGFATSDFGDPFLSEELTGRALAAFQDRPDPWGLAAALSTRAKHAAIRGDLAAARELLEQARRLAGEQAYKPGEVFADISLGALANREGDLDGADARLREVLGWHCRMGHPPDVGKAMALAELAFTAERRGDHEAARQLRDEALAIARELGDPGGILPL